MKKKRIKYFRKKSFLAAMCSVCLLTGCGPKTYTVSEAFEQYNVWYRFDTSEIDATDKPEVFLIQDKKMTNITEGKAKDKDYLTLEEISDLSDEEVIEYYNKRPEEYRTSSIKYKVKKDRENILAADELFLCEKEYDFIEQGMAVSGTYYNGYEIDTWPTAYFLTKVRPNVTFQLDPSKKKSTKKKEKS